MKQEAMPWRGPEPVELPEAPKVAGRSADRRRTARRRELLAAGRHPFMGGPVRTDGETCGSCAHHVMRQRGRVWHKCVLHESSSAATDIRVSWPGCKRWEPADDGEATP